MQFRPGCYEAKIIRPAKLKAKIKVSRHQIEDLSLDSYGDEPPIDADLKAAYRGQILKAQSVNIDGVSSASILSKAVKSVVGQALAAAIDEKQKQE